MGGTAGGGSTAGSSEGCNSKAGSGSCGNNGDGSDAGGDDSAGGCFAASACVGDQLPSWLQRAVNALPADHEATVHDLLEAVGLSEYANKFVSNGWDDLNFLMCLSESALNDVLGKDLHLKPGHVLKLSKFVLFCAAVAESATLS